MILYIIYIEPLLLYLERNLVGLRVAHIPQSVEAYCDDVNVLTSVISDLRIVDSAVTKFEMISGAILSREKKCTIMGFGNWKGRQDWPLEYVRVEESMKVFGIWITSSYKSLIKKNWDFRFEKFCSVMESWSYRMLSLQSRVEVLKSFALSRVL